MFAALIVVFPRKVWFIVDWLILEVLAVESSKRLWLMIELSRLVFTIVALRAKV